MAKKKDKAAKKARTAEKAAKAQAKSAVKTKKKAAKMDDEDDVGIDAILEEYQREQAAFLSVKVAACERPTRRINATLVANPAHNKRELFLFGGESQNGQLAEFYNDLYVYNVVSSQWKKVTSPNSPLPRSGHSMVVHPGGTVLLFGGEFSSPKQATFYHYGDTWLLEPATREWTKLELKKGPSPRSGHRLACWKNYIILHGGFRDLATSTTYLADVWAFDVTTYKWTQLEFAPNALRPDARSGHSLLPADDGVVVWGGYCKVKNKKGQHVGKVFQDCWLLKLSNDLKTVRWERRRKSAWGPSPRVGCSMMHHRGRGVLFGGVYDTDETEESLDSVFFNDLYAYQIAANKWFPLTLRAARKKPQTAAKPAARGNELEANLSKLLGEDDAPAEPESESEASDDDDARAEHPVTLALPHPRFNAATAVYGDALYVYGGIWERGDKEFNLDSMYAIDLSKLNGVSVIWEAFQEEIAEPDEESDEDDDEDDEDEDEDDEDEDEPEPEPELEPEPEPKPDDDDDAADAAQALAVSEDPRPYLPHPRPFESLRAFYTRTSQQFLEWAISSNKDARGKELKREAFLLTEDRWWERREDVRVLEDQYEEIGGIGEIVEREAKVGQKRR
ncbi:uncharacterized protein V1510DRAFT_422634 [Dipodascopsis tothii]|uniref:uncharacterized protein n=1 Tax=Dipodascopsis tothii TaxID=44089 RepID=UPI0034CE8DD9